MIKRKDGRYQATLQIDGTKKYFYGTTQTEVRQKIRDYKLVPEIITFGSVAAEWVKTYEPTVSHKTMSQFSPALKRILEDFGDMPISQIEPSDIQAFILRLKRLCYSSQYIKAHKIVFSKVFDYEITKRGGCIKINPTLSVKVPKAPARKVHAATPEQETIIKQSVDAPFGLFAYLLLYTGCRSQEALALQWSDIDFENNTISISKAITFPHNQPVVKGVKTENSARLIPLLEPLARQLQQIRPSNIQKMHHYLFGGEKPLSQQEYRHRWRQYALATGFRREYFIDSRENRLESLSELHRIPHKRVVDILLTPHQLRHSFATMCLEAELSPEDAKTLLGHADIQTTINIYSDIRTAKQKHAAEKLNKFVSVSKSVSDIV